MIPFQFQMYSLIPSRKSNHNNNSGNYDNNNNNSRGSSNNNSNSSNNNIDRMTKINRNYMSPFR